MTPEVVDPVPQPGVAPLEVDDSPEAEASPLAPERAQQLPDAGSLAASAGPEAARGPAARPTDLGDPQVSVAVAPAVHQPAGEPHGQQGAASADGVRVDREGVERAPAARRVHALD